MLKKTTTLLAAVLFIASMGKADAQEGQVNLHQDETIATLLEQKNEMAKDGQLGDRYRLQLFSGDNNEASTVIRKYRSLFPDWPSTVVFETPNYKVWVGQFRTSLEADRALLQVKNSFPSAFRFKPEKR